MLFRRIFVITSLLVLTLGCTALPFSTGSTSTPEPHPATEQIMIGQVTASPSAEINAMPSPPLPFCTSEGMDWLEKEHSVTCYSYWGPAVREAVTADIHTRINAAYLDLESGETFERTADISYQLSCGSMCYPRWRGMEGVIIMGFTQEAPATRPSFEECVEILSKVKDDVMPPQSLNSVYGYYSCIQTQDGRVGWIRYEDDFRSDLEKGESRITYWMWDKFIYSQR